jgi:integrase/recombinase XerD
MANDLAELTAGEVTAFVVEVCPAQTRGSARMTVTALRSLLAFLHVDGILEGSLVAAVPTAASWRLAGLPQGLAPGEVAKLLAACDRRTRTGRRDFAVLMLLVRLGLRAGEVAALELDDIDWRAGELTVRGKGDRHERLPLPDDVGQALVAYLQRGRPATAQGRRVFVRVRAPHGPMTTGAVSLWYSPPAGVPGWARCGRTGCGTPRRPSCWPPGRRWSRSASCCVTGRS